MDRPKDLYAVLGVAPHADEVVIRAAFKALMLRYHPDRNQSVEAAAKAAAIIEAFAVLGDPARRTEYDDRRRAPLRPWSASPIATSGAARPTAERAAAHRSGFVERWTGKFRKMVAVLGLIAVCSVIVIVALRAPRIGNAAAADPKPVATGSAPAPRWRQTDLDYATVEGAAITLTQVLHQQGMVGARTFSEECHARVEARPSWSEADRCAAFDYAARYMDAVGARSSGLTTDPYFIVIDDHQADQYRVLDARAPAIAGRLARIRAAVEPVLQSAASNAEAGVE